MNPEVGYAVKRTKDTPTGEYTEWLAADGHWSPAWQQRHVEFRFRPDTPFVDPLWKATIVTLRSRTKSAAPPAVSWAARGWEPPRCEHGAALRDHAGIVQEPICGCQLIVKDEAAVDTYAMGLRDAANVLDSIEGSATMLAVLTNAKKRILQLRPSSENDLSDLLTKELHDVRSQIDDLIGILIQAGVIEDPRP